MSKRDTPDEETNDWRAVRGRTARTVRRAGRAPTFPDPIEKGDLLNHLMVLSTRDPEAGTVQI